MESLSQIREVLATKITMAQLPYALPLLVGVVWVIVSMIPRRQRYAQAPIACIDPKDAGKSLPSARERFRTDAINMLQEGYRLYKGRPWYVPSPLGERLMLPAKYVEEIKTAPVDEVDFVATFYEMFEGKYTTMGSRSTLHPRVSRNELNQNMNMVMDPVQSEIQEAFEVHLPATDEWKKTEIHSAIVSIVARVSSRMFGGTDLSHNADWVDSTINFATDGFIGAQAIKQYPRLVRPLVAKFIPALRKIRQHLDTADRVVVPVLRARHKAEEAGWPETGGTPPSDFLQWMLGAAAGEERDDHFIALIQLKLSFAAIHTSAAAPTQLLYDLCAMPEWIPILREEIRQVRESTGDISSKAALAKLEKLDSFMKESQRFNPLLLITFERLMTREHTFSDGFKVPANTQIGVPTHAISMDPALYPDPEKFDGLRFYKLKKALEAEAKQDGAKKDVAAAGKLAFASSNHESMAFGYGRHACPGRWFAGNEIKMIMVYLLDHYEFRFPGGKTGLDSRPASLGVETQYLPNHEAVIEMRARKS